LPVGSSVYISRDYHNSSRMLKRAFVSGMLSTGINVINLFNIPSNVMRHALHQNEKIAAGIHFRQSVYEPEITEIVFSTHEGLSIDTKLAQSIERIFFRENFRRVNYQDIGEVYEDMFVKDRYIQRLQSNFQKNQFASSELRIAVDIMHGSTADTYPQILHELGIDNITLNAYKNEKGGATNLEQSQENLQKIVQSLNLDCGIIIYPNGQKLQLVDDKGNLVYDYILLLTILELLNITTDKPLRALLPAWAPDFIKYPNIEVVREKFGNFKADNLQEYDLIADTDGHFAFSEFGLNKDAVYASIKVLELIQKSQQKISKVIKSLPEFIFQGGNIPCPSTKKGKIMRKFLEDGKDKRTSSVDGVKIWVSDEEWILMVPDQHQEYLNLYVQAEDAKSAGKIFYQYQDKIEQWISE